MNLRSGTNAPRGVRNGYTEQSGYRRDRDTYIRHSWEYNPGRMAAHCEIVEVAHVEDTVGYPCSKEASTKCSDCGAQVCDAHAAHCELCNQTFCVTCLAFHNREQYQKKPAAVDEDQRRKSA